MPVSKHRRRGKPRVPDPDASSGTSTSGNMTLDTLRQEIASPALSFPAKITIAGLWWFEHLLANVGDHWESRKAPWQDRRMAAMLLCVAMDGERGPNDDLAPVLAAMLRPYCPAPTFTEAWEHARNLAPGTVRARAARFLNPPVQHGPLGG